MKGVAGIFLAAFFGVMMLSSSAHHAIADADLPLLKGRSLNFWFGTEMSTRDIRSRTFLLNPNK
jgi:hypothetical protein